MACSWPSRCSASRAGLPRWFSKRQYSSVKNRFDCLLYREKNSSAVSPGEQGLAIKARTSRRQWKSALELMLASRLEANAADERDVLRLVAPGGCGLKSDLGLEMASNGRRSM